MCDCSSNNKPDVGIVPQVTLDPNKYFDWDSVAKGVCVDACIVKQILALWSAGIWTGGCCCGHNGTWKTAKWTGPDVVIEIGEDPEKALEILMQADPDRTWNVLQWQLVNTSGHVRHY